MQLTVSGAIWYWRGPSPYHFVTVPEAQCAELRDISPMVSYGWGMIPVRANIGAVSWTTSLFPKNGGYIVPVKDAVRDALELDVDDVVSIDLAVEQRRRG
jgi:hypothetical protein